MKLPYRSLFTDRLDAALQLAQRLRQYDDSHPLILAIPRGGVPLGKVIADKLNGELDVLLVRKLGAPYDPEYALGAVDESGQVWLSGDLTVPAAEALAQIDALRSDALGELRRRRELYTPARHAVRARGRTVIVVDDGLATGSSMAAALHAARALQPARLVCGVPVAAIESLQKLAPLADEVACLHALSDFGAVSLYYRHFPQVSDDEVVRLLREAKPSPAT